MHYGRSASVDANESELESNRAGADERTRVGMRDKDAETMQSKRRCRLAFVITTHSILLEL